MHEPNAGRTRPQSTKSRSLLRAALCAIALAAPIISVGCKAPPPDEHLEPKDETFAELRAVRRGVTVEHQGEAARAPYTHERLTDGAKITIDDGGLAWIRRDGGSTLLARGAAKLVSRSDALELDEGQLFAESPRGIVTQIATPGGALFLSDVRASIEVRSGTAEVYVLEGEVRTKNGTTAKSGELLTLDKDKASVKPAVAWEDWTGGLATTDRTASPAPFGVGTVGARPAGAQGAPREPLTIQRLDVRVSIDGDFATTEVDETFFNPVSDVVEGIYQFRAPEGALVERFGVDRLGGIAWGYVKEKKAAAAQYQANVYQGSKEDPALLEWKAPGVFQAKLYPIAAGATRRVVVRYTEWLGRSGAKGERRLYEFPMAAEGSDESLPHIEEFTAEIDLSRAHAGEVRAGMNAVRSGDAFRVREHDFVPRADLALELYDPAANETKRGAADVDVVAYRAPHSPDLAVLAPNERDSEKKKASSEGDYLLVPVRAVEVAKPASGLDLLVVVDSSAATDQGSLSLARAATLSLLSHLGKSDRVAVFTGDDDLQPVGTGGAAFRAADAATKDDVASSLSKVAQGGATDLGATLSHAIATLPDDPEHARSAAIVYIGDGSPTVGELTLGDLRTKLAKAPRPARIFALGIGENANMGILAGLANGAFAERIGDEHAAAQAAIRLLEAAGDTVELGVKINLGANVERVYPRELGALAVSDTTFVVGRLTGKDAPAEITVTTASGERKLKLKVETLDDHGDLRRRWAAGRLDEMLADGSGHAALVDLGVRQGIITPVTSFYVPTESEMTAADRAAIDHTVRARRTDATIDGLDAATGEADNRRKGHEDDDAEKQKSKRDEGILDSLMGNKKSDEAPPAKPAEKTAAATSEMRATDNGDGKDRGGEQDKKVYDPMAVAPTPAHMAAATAMATASPPTSQAEPAPQNAPGRDPPQAAARAPATADMERAVRAGDASAAQEMPQKPVDAPATTSPAAPSGADGDRFAGPRGHSGKLDPNAPSDAATGEGQNGIAANKNGCDASDPLCGGGYFKAPDDGTGADIDQSELSLSGVGEGGGGRGAGIGLGNIGGRGDLGGPAGGKGRSAAKEEAREFGMIGMLDESKSKAAFDGRQQVSQLTIIIGDNPGRRVRLCGDAAKLPFEERLGLWRERLAKIGGSPVGAANVYRRAVGACEAPTARERSALLLMTLDFIPSTNQRVALWRTMVHDLGAADVLYRGILARVSTTAQMRELSAALGLVTVEPSVLEKALKEAKSPADKVTKLRALFAIFPNDRNLSLVLLDAIEDAGDAAGARSFARELRTRPDADASVRTSVGELYLRLSTAEADAQKDADALEARRAFGEIVEFSPDDPVARRRLGDLLRAHGFYDEATRQYETLAKLTPGDATVSLLLAACADGQGRLEEAVRWTEKGGSAGAPDVAQGPFATARAFAATYLAWGKLEAKAANQKETYDALSARLTRVLSSAGSPSREGQVRVSLTWSHPELHPALWSNALGAPMPAPEGDVTLGISQVMMPDRAGGMVEVRLDPQDLDRAARLGAKAVLTVVFGENKEGETIVRKEVSFTRGGSPVLKFQVEGGRVDGPEGAK